MSPFNEGTAAVIAVSMAAILLALAFVVAATSKAMLSHQFATVLRISRLPEPSVPVLTRLLPAIELGLGGALLLTRGTALVVVFGLALALLASFVAWMATILARGLSVDCACFGAGARIGRGTISRNVGLAGLAGAGIVVVAGSGEDPAWLGGGLWSVMVVSVAISVVALGTAVYVVRPELVLRFSQVLEERTNAVATR